jgi:hypothetical protein
MVECIRFNSHEKGHLLGFADFYIEKWGIEIPGFTLWMKDGRRWLNAPSTRYTDRDGTEKNRAHIFFRKKEHWDAFCVEAEKAIDDWCEKSKEQSFDTPKASDDWPEKNKGQLPGATKMPDNWEECPF